MVSSWVWEEDLSFFEYNSLVQKNEWHVVLSYELIWMSQISSLMHKYCCWVLMTLNISLFHTCCFRYVFCYSYLVHSFLCVLVVVLAFHKQLLKHLWTSSSCDWGVLVLGSVQITELSDLLGEPRMPDYSQFLKWIWLQYVWNQKPLRHWLHSHPFSGAWGRNREISWW